LFAFSAKKSLFSCGFHEKDKKVPLFFVFFPFSAFFF